MTRGLVVSLTWGQIVRRALYLAGELGADQLDPYVRAPLPSCPVGYYRLAHPNGGEDPTAPDPFARWSERDAAGVAHPRVTADCIAGASWCGGWDRKQPVRFAHLYDGSINTNSMILDVEGTRRCFESLSRPTPGCYVVCRSGSPGHTVGHIGVVVDVPAEWDAARRECWLAVGVVDVASRSGRANRRTTAVGWFATRGRGGAWVRSIMQP